MNKLLFGKILLALIFVLPAPAMAAVNVDVSISLPPPIVFAAPPALVVLPETYVYVVPDADVEIFFFNGWWWRPWEGHWYRSRYYDSGWGRYRSVPSFYGQVPSGWRDDYREHRWRGHQWDHRPIPHKQVQQNWRGWEKNKHWEKQNSWGVQGLKPRTQSQRPSRAVQSKPQIREAEPRHSRPQSQPKPEAREMTGPRPSPQQSREVKQQHIEPQKREARQQDKFQKGKPGRDQEDKQERKQHDK